MRELPKSVFDTQPALSGPIPSRSYWRVRPARQIRGGTFCGRCARKFRSDPRSKTANPRRGDEMEMGKRPEKFATRPAWRSMRQKRKRKFASAGSSLACFSIVELGSDSISMRSQNSLRKFRSRTSIFITAPRRFDSDEAERALAWQLYHQVGKGRQEGIALWCGRYTVIS